MTLRLASSRRSSLARLAAVIGVAAYASAAWLSTPVIASGAQVVERTPHPSSTPCVQSRSVDAQPRDIREGDTTTITVRYQVYQCSEYAPHSTPVYAFAPGKNDGSTPGREVGTVTTAAGPDESASIPDRPSDTTVYSLEQYSRGNGDVTVTVQQPSPDPSPSGAGTPPAHCASPTSVSVTPDTIDATASAGVSVSGPAGARVELYAYTRPSTQYRLVRSGTLSQNGAAGFRVVPPANTRLYALVPDCGLTSPSVVLNVRTTLTLGAVRHGLRDYSFSGDSLPARPGGLIVSLYRVTGDGAQVLTAQTRADAADGNWSIRRVFTGSGRFGFVVRTGQDLRNAPGTSRVRSTLIF